MRIDAYNQVSQLYQASKAGKASRAYDTSSTGRRDQLEISQTGLDYQVAKQAVSAASDIREDKVAELKAKIQQGSYEVGVDDFAAKLLEKYQGIC